MSDDTQANIDLLVKAAKEALETGHSLDYELHGTGFRLQLQAKTILCTISGWTRHTAMPHCGSLLLGFYF